jgi:hypothetical protein
MPEGVREANAPTAKPKDGKNVNRVDVLRASRVRFALEDASMSNQLHGQ